VYEDLLGRSRRLRHHAVLRALEELHPEDREPILDQLAYHSLQAREEVKAARYARLAGDRSARLLAFREALGHYQTALELLETEDPRERAELLEKQAEVAYPLGDSSVYGRCWQEAMRRYQELGDHRKVGVLAIRLGGYYGDSGDHQAALASVSAARDVLEAEPPGHELAMAYAALAQRYWRMDRPQESSAWGEKALRLAAALGDDEVQARALVYIGESLADLGESRRAAEYLERSLAVARRAGAVKEMLNAYFHLGNLLVYDLGELRRATGLYREGLALARQHGWELRMSGDCGYGWGFAQMLLGEWERAHQTLDRAISAGEWGHWAGLDATARKGLLLLWQGRPEDARRLLEEIVPADEHRRSWLSLRGPILARVRLALGDSAGALAAMETWVDAWRGAGSPPKWGWPLGVGVEVYLGAGRHEQAEELLRELSASAERPAARMAQATLADGQGLVAAHEGRHVEAAAHFRQEAVRWQEMEAPYPEAHARRLGAASLLRSGDRGHREEARTELAAAQAICTTLGAPLELEAIATLTTQYSLAPRLAQPSTSQTNALTRREREVIALLARGYSNPAIAAALVISERTAEHHVANILSKLGCVSRAQAAAYAVEHGLATPSPA
jgi:DNA-binding CsgD family transcriptional regulator